MIGLQMARALAASLALATAVTASAQTAASVANPAPRIANPVRAPSMAERAKVARSLQAAHLRLLDDPAYVEAFARSDSKLVSERLRATAGVEWPVMVRVGSGAPGPAGLSFGFACKTQDSFPWLRCWGGVSL